MKLQLLVTKPTIIDIKLKIGDLFKSSEPSFEPLIQELGELKLVGKDTCGYWSWKDFFQHNQPDDKGGNTAEVKEIEVINYNSSSDCITLKLTYDNDDIIIAILKEKTA